MIPRLRAYTHWLEYLFLALLILGPLMLPGYILTFDMVWGPQHWGGVGAADAVQKLLLLGILTTAGVGAQKLTELTASRLALPATYLAGFLYVVNPFTYTRFVAGQYLVLAGYALLPWLARAVWRLLEQPSLRRTLAVVAWSGAVGLVSLHSVGLAAVLSGAVVVAWGWGRWRQLRAALPWLAMGGLGWLAVSAVWLVPLVLGRSAPARLIASFDASQFAAYATAGGAVGVPFNVLSLQGFWGDPDGRYVLASSTGLLFWAAWGLLLGLVAVGLAAVLRRRDRLGLALAAAGLVAWVLAMGVAWGPVAGLNQWLVEHVPFYRGYREPGKWTGLIVLAYAYLGAGGLAVVRRALHRWPAWRVAGTGLALLLPLGLAPMLLWGAGGQLRSTAYPPDWYELDRRLQALPANAGVLLLPWHLYLHLDFAGRNVANPAPVFFHRPLLGSNDPELLGMEPPQDRTIDRVMAGQVLPRRFFATDLGASLAAAGVQYVVLLKQADWAHYDWLDRQAGLRLVGESQGWRLYEVEAAP